MAAIFLVASGCGARNDVAAGVAVTRISFVKPTQNVVVRAALSMRGTCTHLEGKTISLTGDFVQSPITLICRNGVFAANILLSGADGPKNLMAGYYDTQAGWVRWAVSFTKSYCAEDLLTHSPYAEGAGTLSDPYTLCTANQLAAISANSADWGANFKLMASVDLASQEFTPIARTANPFIGVFDGNNLTVSHLQITHANLDAIGFFAAVGAAGVVKNLTLENVAVQGHSSVGALAGTSAGTISGIHVNGAHLPFGDVQAYKTVGGAVGDNSGAMSAVHTDVRVVSTGEACLGGASGGAGGAVGVMTAGTLANSSAIGPVTSTLTIGCGCTGGLLGFSNQGSTVSQSFATGDVTSGGAVVGGLVGWVQGTLHDAYATGAVSGGIAGANSCAFETTQSFTGGFVGADVFSGVIQNAYATGSVRSTGTYVGGFSGLIYSGGQTSNSFSTGVATGSSFVGGYASTNNGGTVAGAYWDIFKSGLQSGVSSGSTTGIVGIDTSQAGNQGYFFSSANAPLAQWDFVNIWLATSNGYPTLR